MLRCYSEFLSKDNNKVNTSMSSLKCTYLKLGCPYNGRIEPKRIWIAHLCIDLRKWGSLTTLCTNPANSRIDLTCVLYIWIKLAWEVLVNAWDKRYIDER